ncbi:hypothetical protein M0Q28_05615 [Patescibacteria group bacterium]|jgi:hypothetical protein|nr:hypothetical protein [Patescibacteria group bacterium]
MSKPFGRDAVSEIQSAISALHMEPEPLPGPFDDEEPAFLAYRDKWAAHAIEHLRSAINILIDREIADQKKAEG